MFSVKKIKSKNTLYILLFIILFLLTRVPRLHNDILNTDAVYWHDRSEKFIKALNEKDYKETYQMYHPGVTLMWITGLTAEVSSRVNATTIDDVFSNIPKIHYQAKLVLIFLQLALSLILIHLLSKIFDFKLAVLMVSLFSLEPFFVGNSRLLHLDGQISLYVLIGITLSYLYSKKYSFFGVVAAGFFIGLAALSKTLFVGSALFCLFAGTGLSFFTNGFKSSLKFFFTFLITFFVTYLLLFPAFWVAPVETLTTIINDSIEVGSKDGHKQIFFGELNRKPGVMFYPVLLGLKVSLFTALGIAIYLGAKIFEFLKNLSKRNFKIDLSKISFVLFMSIFYIGYFLVITYFSKKVDRYIVPMFPFFGVLAVLGYYQLNLKRKITKLVMSAILIFSIAIPLIRVFPHYMTYINPAIGSAEDGNEIIGQKLFGIGVFELRELIDEKYGDDTKVAMNDYKTLKLISEEDLVYDISSEHPNSYKLMILGPNKEPPSSVANSGVRFRYKESIYINGLEFWRIYKKR